MQMTLRRLWDHLAWADALLLTALEGCASPPSEAIREYAHILGADDTWLSRLEGRPPTVPVWPQMEVPQLRRFAQELHASFSRYLAALDATQLMRDVAYATTDGRTFATPAQDILLHVALHAQYHRGKINLLLRQAGVEPAATDYIAFIRGAPARVPATTPAPKASP